MKQVLTKLGLNWAIASKYDHEGTQLYVSVRCDEAL